MKRAKPATPRFTGDRRSGTIGKANARRMIAAAIHAAVIGRPLNRFITVHWNAGAVDAGSRPTTRFLKLAGDWLALDGVPRSWVWAREGGDAKGDHVHILMHVPPQLCKAFANRQRGWLAACGASYWNGVIKTEAIGATYATAGVGPLFSASYTVSLFNLVDYLLKGANQATADALGLIRPRSDEGVLTGKRTATSESIGTTARKRWTELHPESPAATGARLGQIKTLAGYRE